MQVNKRCQPLKLVQVNKGCQPLKLKLRELLWETFWGKVGELVDLFRFWQTMRGNGASTLKDWREYLNKKEDSAITATIFQNTKTGRPCGDEAFVGMIAGLVGRRLAALPVNRPKKTI